MPRTPKPVRSPAEIAALDEDALLTMHEVTAYLQISRPTVYRFCELGRLTRYHVGESVRFRVGDVRKLIRD